MCFLKSVLDLFPSCVICVVGLEVSGTEKYASIWWQLN
jgi:hypothetical protein